ncbi:type II toxin-antitoxin system HicB family antitoxin [Pasteurella multocida]|uniref:type II toxin-antitoxin system HicB family antitoxin n=1 Tax=Pasteurella multocida TaxID=747 RepID=UPI002024487E|nr:hypothetical protein [Pasteurella multocida]URJ87891.1 hypothetical protein M9421_04180 [Pasteurella multocida]URJ89885.1 hypothetical protein M9412_04175 [Pasteurella multocida]HEP1081836.1 hypothetical protein [Pasteurella multocida]
MRKYSVITYREDETVEDQPFIIATGKTHQEAVQIAREAMDNDPLVYGAVLRKCDHYNYSLKDNTHLVKKLTKV